jgi:glycerol uptake facilitator-like aquaporin
MAQSLTNDGAVALLCNTLPTGAILVVLITILGPISGAHFNPAVSLVFALKRHLSAQDAAFYVLAQLAGGIAGTITAHLMFALPLVAASSKVRTGGPQWFAEWVATFGLIVTIFCGLKLPARRCRGSSGSTSRPPTGLPRPRRLPIRLSWLRDP